MYLSPPQIAGIKAALYSWYISTYTIMSVIVATGWALGVGTPSQPAGGFNDWPTFVVFIKHVWFAGLVGLVFQLGVRSQQSRPHLQPPVGTRCRRLSKISR